MGRASKRGGFCHETARVCFSFPMFLSALALAGQISLTPVLEAEGPSGHDMIILTIRME